VCRQRHSPQHHDEASLHQPDEWADFEAGVAMKKLPPANKWAYSGNMHKKVAAPAKNALHGVLHRCIFLDVSGKSSY
jgi:hypothetical protein